MKNIFTNIKAFIGAHKIAVIGTAAAVAIAGCAGVAVAVAHWNNDVPPANDDVTTVNTETIETADTTVFDTGEGTTYEPEATEISSEIISETVADEPETDETVEAGETTFPMTGSVPTDPTETTAEPLDTSEGTTDTEVEVVETPEETTAAPVTKETTTTEPPYTEPVTEAETNPPYETNQGPNASELIPSNMSAEERAEQEQRISNCRYCGDERSTKHYRPFEDTNCPYCGVFVAAKECHDCGK